MAGTKGALDLDGIGTAGRSEDLRGTQIPTDCTADTRIKKKCILIVLIRVYPRYPRLKLSFLYDFGCGWQAALVNPEPSATALRHPVANPGFPTPRLHQPSYRSIKTDDG